jgi:uracil-DNA glycosylase family 4
MTTISTIDPVRSPVVSTAGLGTEPDRDCPLCPRLVEFRQAVRAREPGWFNSPVPPFGDANGALLIVGLAPGLQGANRTGRPFTGDYAGDLLYATLLEYGFASGVYQARPDDGLTLVDCRIGNAVHCVPPQNKPLPVEINTCRQFLLATMATMPRLRAIVALGRIAHESTVKAWVFARHRRRFRTARCIRPARSGCTTAIIARDTTRTRGC